MKFPGTGAFNVLYSRNVNGLRAAAACRHCSLTGQPSFTLVIFRVQSALYALNFLAVALVFVRDVDGCARSQSQACLSSIALLPPFTSRSAHVCFLPCTDSRKRIRNFCPTVLSTTTPLRTPPLLGGSLGPRVSALVRSRLPLSVALLTLTPVP